MKHYIFLSMMLLFVYTGYSQDQLPCPNGNNAVIGHNPPTTHAFTPPTNPKNPTPTPELPNDRLIYWIHGLGGNGDSWAKVAQATQYQSPSQQVPGYPARKVTSLPLTYSQFSLSGAASSLHNMIMTQGDPASIANNITDRTDNFIIAHSQGGIVSRATDMMYDQLGPQIERRFGGIVTFGSPHAGAKILNNKDQFGAFSEDGCNALISGPLEDSIQNLGIVSFFISGQTFHSLKEGFCNFLADQVAPIMFQDQFQDITEDYKVGAVPIAELNTHTSTIPHVAFYGIEEEPVLYRTMYNLKVKKPNSYDHFKADDDQYLVTKFDSLFNEYNAKYEAYAQLVTHFENEGMPCDAMEWILHLNKCTVMDPAYWHFLRRRDMWALGVHWLRNANKTYKTIIGADQSHWVTTYTCTCNGSSFPTNQPSCPPGCTRTNAVSYWLTEEYQSDGVILVESASAYPGAMTRDMPKSNHQQMRNDSNTKTRLKELFDGGYGDYFITAVR
jgi:pimeloyl-ACP methyl ester carboxylesterase